MSEVQLPVVVSVAGESADPGRGRVTYEAKCAPCHGLDGRGGQGLSAADLTAPGVLDKDDGALLRSIAGGVPGTSMPAWAGQLDAAARRDVLAFIRVQFGVGEDAPVE